MRRSPQWATVHSTERLTPHMQRLRFGGLVDFPQNHEGANIKLLLAPPGQTEPDLASFPQGPNRPVVRTYTVRDFDSTSGLLTVDFALHAHGGGPAMAFALNARPGDKVGIAGPGQKKIDTTTADWFLFVADMSALPAAAAIIDILPAHATGFARFLITSDDDRQPMTPPAGLQIQWQIHANEQEPAQGVIAALATLPWPAGIPGIFVAGEGTLVQQVRRWLLDTQGLSRADIYASPYWRIGLSEDQHQLAKRQAR